MDEKLTRVVVVRPGAEPVAEEVAGFAGVKALLGGAHLERIRFGRYDVLCDEDGLRKQLPGNRGGLVGLFVVTHLTHPDLTPLTDAEVAEVVAVMKAPWAPITPASAQAPWEPPPPATLLRVRPDTRSQRWKDAESSCGRHGAAPEDLAIIEEEQAKWDQEHPECTRCGFLLADCACLKTLR
jgi:hypothetical protein